MFSYYGSKSKIINKYPEPKHNLIIEPFAGSARYALKYWEKEVILMEKFDKVYKVWKYLQSASAFDILGLPDVPPSTKLSDIERFSTLADEEKWLIGFCANRGSAVPKHVSGKFSNWDKDKIRISKELHKIKHWDIRFGSYESLENVYATWYIDPPYQKQGIYYKSGNGNALDYGNLGDWCESRQGQVIVCENMGADWLPFKPLIEFHGSKNKNTEAIFIAENDENIPDGDVWMTPTTYIGL